MKLILSVLFSLACSPVFAQTVPVWQYLDPVSPSSAVWLQWRGPVGTVSSADTSAIGEVRSLPESIYAVRLEAKSGVDTIRWTLTLPNEALSGRARLSSSRPWKLVVFGDTQRASSNHEGMVFRHAATRNPDMAIIVGDWAMSMSSTETYAVRLMRIFSMAPELWRNVVVFPVAGNHDRGAVPGLWFRQYTFPFSAVRPAEAGTFPTQIQLVGEGASYVYGGIRLVVANGPATGRWGAWWKRRQAEWGPEPILAFIHYLDWAKLDFAPLWGAEHRIVAWHHGHFHSYRDYGVWIKRMPPTYIFNASTSPTYLPQHYRDTRLAPPEVDEVYIEVVYTPATRQMVRRGVSITGAEQKSAAFDITLP